MQDIKDISDLRPAPRRTPTPVLWLMGAVVAAGSMMLVVSTQGAANDAQAFDKSHRHYVVAVDKRLRTDPKSNHNSP